ncbi:MAG: glycosyltransferase family 2 protein [Planctomycetota bacterium]
MPSPRRRLIALPVYNEAAHLAGVLDKVVRHAEHVLVVDDGSTDGSTALLAQREAERGDIILARHEKNRGYGAALCTAFAYAIEHGFEVLVTIDCDGQHEPQLIGELAQGIHSARGEVDIVSGSRYLNSHAESTGAAPPDRRQINQTITRELNGRLGLSLTDAFCGFKAYRVASLKELRLSESGYAMPLELWVQAAHHGLVIREAAVPLIYLDEERSFGGELDKAEQRLAYYRSVIARALAAARPVDAACRATCEAPAEATNATSC